MVLHVLNYHQKSADYMIGAQLEGLEIQFFCLITTILSALKEITPSSSLILEINSIIINLKLH